MCYQNRFIGRQGRCVWRVCVAAVKAGRLCRVCFRPLGGGGLFICFLSFERLRLSPLPVVEVQNVRFRVTRPPYCFAVLFCLVCPFRAAACGF